MLPFFFFVETNLGMLPIWDCGIGKVVESHWVPDKRIARNRFQAAFGMLSER